MKNKHQLEEIRKQINYEINDFFGNETKYEYISEIEQTNDDLYCLYITSHYVTMDEMEAIAHVTGDQNPHVHSEIVTYGSTAHIRNHFLVVLYKDFTIY